MLTILITGAANGLGAAFVQAYEKENNNTIIAVDREEISSSQQHANIQRYVVDTSSQESINTFTNNIESQPIDLVIHSAGIRGLVPEISNQKPDSVASCETLQIMDLETLMRTFQINAAGTFLFIRSILPNLLLATNAKVIVMSSRMGSIGNNKTAGGGYAYRASKAALNALVRSLAVDVPEVTFVLCHPGRVETKLVGWMKEEGAISAEESVQGIVGLIEGWGKGDSGEFYDRLGGRVEW